MQEFLSGSAFEQMAREYNAKYGRASALNKQSSFLDRHDNSLFDEQFLNNANEKREGINDNFQIEKEFEKISSLFYFLKNYIKKMNKNYANNWQDFLFKKLSEVEEKLNNLKQNIMDYV